MTTARDVRAEVEQYLADNPRAGRAEVFAAVPRRKQDVLVAYNAICGESVVSPVRTPASRESPVPAVPATPFGIEGARWDETSLDLPPDLSFEDYEFVGRRLGVVRDATQWALGDWINYGEAVFGEKYAQAVEATGRRPQKLMNCASVARRVARPRRRPGVAWSIHEAVASLDPDEQVKWLDAVVANGWTVAELRGILREPDLPTAVEVVPMSGGVAAVVQEWLEHFGDDAEAEIRTALVERKRSDQFYDVMGSSLSDEWHSPPVIVEAAREVFGGVIDLDPASCELANRTVRADRYYTIDDDGLTQPWHGRCLVNPPYGGKPGAFVRKLLAEYESGNVTAAVLIVSAHSTDTEWFQQSLDHPVCFTRGRVDFTNPARSGVVSNHGTAFVYFGPEPDRFAEVFGKFGRIVQPYTVTRR